MDQTLELSFVLKAVDRALEQAQPKIWNKDQGSISPSAPYINRFISAGVRIRMDGQGCAIDNNIITECLWRTVVKYKEVYPNDYSCPCEAVQSLNRYFNFYNFVRPHKALEYQTPAQVYAVKYPALLDYFRTYYPAIGGPNE